MNQKQSENGRKSIPTLVKDSSLVESKRQTIVEAAVGLFVRKGYHETTTREIAREAGLSIGSLYEYVQSKEDVLYLVCDSIHLKMEARLREEIGEGRAANEILDRPIDDRRPIAGRNKTLRSVITAIRVRAALAHGVPLATQTGRRP